MVVHGRRTAIGRAKRGGFKVEAAGPERVINSAPSGPRPPLAVAAVLCVVRPPGSAVSCATVVLCNYFSLNQSFASAL